MDIVKAESDIKFLKGLVRADTYGLTLDKGRKLID